MPESVGAHSSGNCPGFTPGSLLSFSKNPDNNRSGNEHHLTAILSEKKLQTKKKKTQTSILAI
jgi:hypothetical protein